ncbi:MAG: hypothetical protein CMJ36_02410, partial [Phycisphaerae bacterium]|nr:hypothetical protein [Phycisphaerae bacterium]
MTRILVVDDKEMMRDSVGAMLASKGHSIVVAACATEAIEKIDTRSFDVVITDLQMPDIDGVGLLKEIRERDETLPVILMTGFGTVESAVEAIKLEAFD